MARVPLLHVCYCGDVPRFSRLQFEYGMRFTAMETNHRFALDAGIAPCFQVEEHSPSANESERWPT
jgi:hypothetical protein